MEHTSLKFEVLIDEEGKMHLRTTGFQGPSCISERNKLAALLAEAGINAIIEEVQTTDEYCVGTRAEVKAKKR